MLTRADLATLPSYTPGRSTPGAIKLSSNEVPYGLLPGVAEAIEEAAATSHRYPDMGVAALREELADRLGVGIERVATGCGSVALTEHLAKATCRDGDEIVHAWRSFEAYPIITTTTGANGVRVPNTAAHEHDLSAISDAVTGRTRMILVCNPNNPTGTAINHTDLEKFLDSVPPKILVVIDEAYREFVTDPGVPDGLTAYGGRPNVVVLRTMSKAWGLAGLRIGFMVADERVTAAVRKVITPFSVSSVAQAAATAALAAEVEMRRRVELVVAERERVYNCLAKYLPGMPASQANFVWLPLGQATADFAAACAAGGVMVRPFPEEGVRVTIGTPDENDQLLAAAEPFLAERAS